MFMDSKYFMLAMVLCLLALLPSNASALEYEYQENATEIGFAGSWNYPLNLYDGNYSTYALGQFVSGNYYYENYTKSINSTNSSLYQTKLSGVLENNTIPQSCWDYLENKLMFRLESYNQEGGYAEARCYNGVWIFLVQRGSDVFQVYEAGMWWGIEEISQCNYSLIENATEISQTGSWIPAHLYNLSYDNNYSTYAESQSGQSFIYENYTKPENAINESLWEVKFDNRGIINYSIPFSCWDYLENKLMFRLLSWETEGGGSWIYCYDGSWNQIQSSIGDTRRLYEDSMFWCLNITEPEPEPLDLTNITIIEYYCTGNYSVRNVTFNNESIVTFIKCDNGCNENNLVITVFGNEANLCNPSEWLQWIVYIALLVIVFVVYEKVIT